MKDPSNALPNALSFGGSVRTRLAYWNNSIHYFPYSFSAPHPCGRLLAAPAFRPDAIFPVTPVQVPQVPRPLANCTWRGTNTKFPSLLRCWKTICMPIFAESLIPLIQRRLSNKDNFLQQPQWKTGSRPGCWWDRAAHPSPGLPLGAWCRAQCQVCVVFVRPPEGQQRHQTAQRKCDARLRGAGWLQGASTSLSFSATSHSSLRQVP